MSTANSSRPGLEPALPPAAALVRYTAVLTMLLVLGDPCSAFAQDKRVIPGSPDFPYSEGVAVGNTLYVAGQQGDENGRLKSGDIPGQTRQTLENLAKVVKAAGFELSDVVAVTVYWQTSRNLTT